MVPEAAATEDRVPDTSAGSTAITVLLTWGLLNAPEVILLEGEYSTLLDTALLDEISPGFTA